MSSPEIKPGLVFLADVNPEMKAVQLFIQDLPILGLGEHGQEHGEILDQILNQFDIPFERELLRGSGFYAKKGGEGELYVAVGMGLADLNDFGDNRIVLYGDSGTYPLEPNQEHLDRLVEYAPQFRITI